MSARARDRVRSFLVAVAVAAPVVLLVTGGWQRSASAAPVFSFGVAGDLGANTNTAKVLDAVAASGVNAFFPLGDLSYSEVTPESQWCDFVKQHVGTTRPVDLVVGNHEDDGPDGTYAKFAACLPERLGGSVGDYPREYYVDYPAASPLVRFIAVSPGLVYGGQTWSYKKSSTQTHYAWTRDRIDEAKTAKIPFVVLMLHQYCISLVPYSCSTGPDLLNLSLEKGVDLYLQAHDHAYNRSKQLGLSSGCTGIVPDSFDADCIANASSSSSYTAGRGTVVATGGTGGKSLNRQYPTHVHGPYFQTYQGNESNGTFGFLKVDVSTTQLAASFVRGSGGSFTDTFTITRSTPPPSPTPTPSPTATASPTPSPTPSPTLSPSPAPSPTPSPSPTPPGPGPFTLTAVSDAYVQSNQPNTPRGGSSSLTVDSSPTDIAYLKFDASALAGRTISSAQLLVTTTSSRASGSPDTQRVHPVFDSNWTESSLTYNNRPPVDAAVIGTQAGPTTRSTTYAITLDAAQVQALLGGQLTLALDSVGGAGDAFTFASREASGNKPRLVLNLS